MDIPRIRRPGGSSNGFALGQIRSPCDVVPLVVDAGSALKSEGDIRVPTMASRTPQIY